MSRTKKPCPLCKEPGVRNADDVCTGCRRKHERLLKLEAELEARGSLEVWNIPVEQWPGRAPFQFHISAALYKALSRMLLAVCPLSSKAYPEPSHSLPYHQHYYTVVKPLLMTTEGAESIKAFFDLMHAEFERCASQSINEGKSLLLQFAQGGITADDLNQAGMKDGRL